MTAEWGHRRITEINQMVAQGLSYENIAAKCSLLENRPITRKMVAGVLFRNRHSRRLTPKLEWSRYVDDVADRLDRGESYDEIAAHYASILQVTVNRNMISGMIRRYKLTGRSKLDRSDGGRRSCAKQWATGLRAIVVRKPRPQPVNPAIRVIIAARVPARKISADTRWQLEAMLREAVLNTIAMTPQED